MKLNDLQEYEDKQRLLKSFIALRGDSNFEHIVEFFRLNQEKQDKALRRKTEGFQLIQGKAQILEDFLNLVECAPDLLKELQESTL